MLPQDLPLDIVFEDDTLLVVNKAAGMVTHPSHGSVDNTLVNALLAHTGTLPGEPIRAGLVHRLDRDTSGLLLVAKTDEALGTLGRAMQKRYIKREYRGIVAGVPRELDGVIRGAIGRDPHNRLKYAIRADGKPAVTHYALRATLQGCRRVDADASRRAARIRFACTSRRSGFRSSTIRSTASSIRARRCRAKRCMPGGSRSSIR